MSFHDGDKCNILCSHVSRGDEGDDVQADGPSKQKNKLVNFGERLMLEEKIDDLHRQISAAQDERKKLMAMKDEAHMLQRIRMEKRNKDERKKDSTISMLQSVVSHRVNVENRLEETYRMDAINDCFHIWHRRPYGTINGLRAGSFVPSICSAIRQTDFDNLNNPTVGAFDFDLSSMFPNSGSSGLDLLRDQVSWFETNAALGTAALLLATLQEKPGSNIQFSTYDIIPMGSYSKIATKVTGTAVPTVYNLFSDDRFSFFGKRSFNKALQGILQCLLDAEESVTKLDKTMQFPYPISENTLGELVIGGLSITHGTDSERWTRALKYFLTNLKWLVAFVVKHAER